MLSPIESRPRRLLSPIKWNLVRLCVAQIVGVDPLCTIFGTHAYTYAYELYMDLKSFSETHGGDPYTGWRDEKVLHKQPEPTEKTLDESDIRDAISQYSQMSNDQLMMMLATQVAQKKQDGESGNMREMVAYIEPFLDADQKKRLEQIVKQLGI